MLKYGSIFIIPIALIALCLLVNFVLAADNGFVNYDARPTVGYDCKPCLAYSLEPVKHLEEKVEKVAKVVTRKVRKLVGYRKVCTPNGCVMEPVYQVVEEKVNNETKPKTKAKEVSVLKNKSVEVEHNACDSNTSCNNYRRPFDGRLLRRLFR